jgi:diacylglycerol kinase family enzyme
MNVRALLGGLGGALRGGGVTESSTLDVRTDLAALSISHDSPFPYQLDGDYLGETKVLEFTHVPNAVKLVRPVSAPGR